MRTFPPDDGAGRLSAARALAEICCMAGALYRDSIWNGLVLYPDRGQSRVAAASESSLFDLLPASGCGAVCGTFLEIWKRFASECSHIKQKATSLHCA